MSPLLFAALIAVYVTNVLATGSTLAGVVLGHRAIARDTFLPQDARDEAAATAKILTRWLVPMALAWPVTFAWALWGLAADRLAGRDAR